MKPIIYMDERERGQIRDEFQLFECHLKIKTLPIGDYVIANHVGIERKRGDDLAASICDKRFFKQLLDLSQTFSNPILILEDYKSMFGRDISENSLYGAILFVGYKWNVRVIPTDTTFGTAQTIWSLAKYYQNHADFNYTPPILPEQEINKESQIDFLEGLVNVSVKKANQLLDHFDTPGKIIQALLDTEIEKSKNGKPNKIKGPFKKIKGFGPVFIEKNKKLFCTRYK